MKAYTFHSFVSLAFICLGGLLGIGLLLISINPSLCTACTNAFQHDSGALLLSKVALFSGGSLIALSTILFTLFYALNKKSSYQVQLRGNLELSIEKKLLTQFLSRFFTEQIPGRPIDFTLKAKGQKMEVLADFSEIPIEQHEDLVDALEPRLMELMSKRFGTSSPITLSIFCKEA